MAWKIRPREESDLDRCVQLMTVVHSTTGYPLIGVRNAHNFLSSPSDLQTWVAEQDGEILGQATVGGKDLNDCSVALWIEEGRTEDIRTFKRLFVNPESHGLGIARNLVKATTDYADQHNFRLVLFVLYEQFPGARKMYEKLGWEKYGETTFSLNDGRTMPAACYVSPSSR